MRAAEQRAAVPPTGKHPEEAGPWPERRETMLVGYRPIGLGEANGRWWMGKDLCSAAAALAVHPRKKRNPPRRESAGGR